jgi:hypothetical protein
MFSKQSGVKNHFFTTFPITTAWHCTHHKLEFGANGDADGDAELNHLHIFCDKLYLSHHMTNKNQDKLSTCMQSLHCQLWKHCAKRTVGCVIFIKPSKQQGSLIKLCENTSAK